MSDGCTEVVTLWVSCLTKLSNFESQHPEERVNRPQQSTLNVRGNWVCVLSIIHLDTSSGILDDVLFAFFFWVLVLCATFTFTLLKTH